MARSIWAVASGEYEEYEEYEEYPHFEESAEAESYSRRENEKLGEHPYSHQIHSVREISLFESVADFDLEQRKRAVEAKIKKRKAREETI